MKNLTINVGDYVRTRKGIDKIIDYIGQKLGDNVYEVTQNGTFMQDDCFKYFIFESDIIKLSPNIIDLIEVGDYVNGKQVTKINLDKTMNGETAILCGDSNYDCLDVIYKNRDIKTIVTHEQMEAMEYKIER